ncbi:protocatechuate 3,4-dioxygenase subunit beta [bacterium SCGC AG-212-C10]|nr:protocatechuate 3,4-dioxygenase subunit beta [bacterium SCGC AG-212-C10]
MTDYRRDDPAGQPPYLFAGYRSTAMRAPSRPLVTIPQTLSETTGPSFGEADLTANDADLTAQHADEPLGQRIIVAGRILDGDGQPIPHTLVEIWQANAAGRYRDPGDQHDAPLDSNFGGGGRCLTDSDGGYRFVTIHPGAYPWGNHENAWRPAHIHFSLFGPALATRLVTQMYFPGDPLIPYDPIMESIADEAARGRLIAAFDLELTEPGHALGYRFDIVLRGRGATPFEDEPDD